MIDDDRMKWQERVTLPLVVAGTGEDHAPLEIDVLQPHRHQLADAEAGHEGRHEERLPPVFGLVALSR